MKENVRINIRERINNNKNKLHKLDLSFQRACCPDGVSNGTSYFDYDTIHGSRKEFNLEDYYNARRRLLTFIALDEQILESYYEDIADSEYLEMLETNEQKVAYCRIVKGYTQEKTAELINMSLRQVQRIEQKI